MTNYFLLNARSDRSVLRTMILDGAEAELSECGYRSLTAASVGNRAGLAESIVSLICGNKRSLTLACIDRMRARLMSRLRAIAHASQPVPYRLRQILLTRVLARFDAVHPFQADLEDMVRELEPALATGQQRDSKLESHCVRNLLNTGARQGVVWIDNARAAAKTLIVATNALLPPHLKEDGIRDRVELQRATASLVEMLLRGLA